VEGEFPFVCNPQALLTNIVADLRSGRALDAIAGRVHATMANWLVEACCRIRDRSRLETVALSGGTFQNVLLLEQAVARLEKKGFRVLVHRLAPPNDGGIALGQAATAAAQIAASSR
jgi:hydrogenase maturation protein HypF